MKAYWGSRGTAPRILWPRHQMEVSGRLHTPAILLPGKEPLVPTGQEVRWAPEPFWTRWWREKFPAPAGNRTPIVQPIARRHSWIHPFWMRRSEASLPSVQWISRRLGTNTMALQTNDHTRANIKRTATTGDASDSHQMFHGLRNEDLPTVQVIQRRNMRWVCTWMWNEALLT
jgi:hypothetical protein